MKHLISFILFLCSWSTQAQYEFRFFNIQEGLANTDITTIIEDQQGFIWIGTRDGLCRYDGTSVRTFEFVRGGDQLNNGYVHDLYQDAEGRIWIGTFGGGLQWYLPEKEQFFDIPASKTGESPLLSDHILQLFPDSQGLLWVLTLEGINQVDTKSGQVVGSLMEGIFMRIMEEDRHGDFWFGGDDLYRYRSATSAIEKMNTAGMTGIKSNDFTALMEDQAGHIWVGTRESGLYQLIPRGDTFETNHYTYDADDERSISSNGILSLFERDGQLWVGTENGGLCLFNPSDQTFIQIKQDLLGTGLMGNSVFEIYEDSKKRFGSVCLARESICWIHTESNSVKFLMAWKALIHSIMGV